MGTPVDDSPTAAADPVPTEQSPFIAETPAIPTAYSDEFPPAPDDDPIRSSWWRPAALAAAILTVAAALAVTIYLVGHRGHHTTPMVAAPERTSVTSSPPTTLEPPSPPTITVTVESTPTPPPSTESAMNPDEKFLALMRIDRMTNAGGDAAAIANARQMCTYLTGNGLTQHDGLTLLQSQGWDFNKAIILVTNAAAAYCPNVSAG